MKMVIFLKAVCVSAAVLLSTSVFGQLIRNPAAELQEFCTFDAPRKTLVYLDQSVIAKNDGDWFKDILNKIDYLPSEEIHVVMISAQNSRVQEVWRVCHPSLSRSNYELEKQKDSIFSRGVDNRIQDARQLFDQLMIQSLAQPLATTALVEKPSYTSNFPQKSILEAIYYDSGRFNLDENKITRVIIFSDMVENSELFSPTGVGDPSYARAAALAANQRYPVSFNGASFYVYGVGYTNTNSSLAQHLKAFWENWLHGSGGYLASFNTQLVVPTVGELESVAYRGIMRQLDGSNVAVQLRLGFAGAGKLESSWFGIQNVRYPLSGEYLCANQICEINAAIQFADASLELFRVGDVLKLKGQRDQPSGTVGAIDDLTRTPNGEVFSMQVEFTKEPRINF
jgi:hypothetical protein